MIPIKRYRYHNIAILHGIDHIDDDIDDNIGADIDAIFARNKNIHEKTVLTIFTCCFI